MSETITLTNNSNGEQIELNLRKGTTGPDAVEISALYNKKKILCYDPGFVSTASCESAITYIDGEQGILRYRGYPIEQLAEKSTFLEVAHLLIHGELPNQEELTNFEEIIIHHTMIKESMRNFFNGFQYNAHPMSVMIGVVA